MSWPWPGEQGGDSSWGAGSRRRLGHRHAVGVLVDWQDKGAKSFGWISPVFGVPEHPEAKYHGGDIYVHWQDIQDPRPGAIYTFWPYSDKQGLGAEECSLRSVARFIIPAAAAPQVLRLPPTQMNSCSTYLSSSVFFPEIDEAHNVTLRKYLWEGPYTVLEIWGAMQDIVEGAEAIGLIGCPQTEVLVSRNMARQEAPDSLRDIPEVELPNVPERFRVALSLGSSRDQQRERLINLLGS
mmetsp:Transcript_34078/g.54395  ORF Transcript_34078/g.54395 Transcript_34078/m.54395 type:complete len:239 (+) Transcript_34078:65-781(+)